MTLIAFDAQSLITDSCNIAFSNSAPILRRKSKIHYLPSTENASVAVATSGEGDADSTPFKEMLNNLFFVAFSMALVRGEVECPVLNKVDLKLAIKCAWPGDEACLIESMPAAIGITKKTGFHIEGEQARFTLLSHNHHALSIATGGDYQLLREAGLGVKEAFDTLVRIEPTIAHPMHQAFMDELSEFTTENVQAMLDQCRQNNDGVLYSAFKLSVQETLDKENTAKETK